MSRGIVSQLGADCNPDFLFDCEKWPLRLTCPRCIGYLDELVKLLAK